MKFDITHHCGKSRRGRLSLAHGDVETPVFMPVGTQGSVKAIEHRELEGIDAGVAAAQVEGQLPVVHLGHQDLLEPLEQRAQVPGERVEPAQVDVGDRLALRLQLLGGAAAKTILGVSEGIMRLLPAWRGCERCR